MGMATVTGENTGHVRYTPRAVPAGIVPAPVPFGGGISLRRGNPLSPGRAPLRGLMDDRLLDALLERSRDEAGGLRLTDEGSMLGELVKGGARAGAGGRADRPPWV